MQRDSREGTYEPASMCLSTHSMHATRGPRVEQQRRIMQRDNREGTYEPRLHVFEHPTHAAALLAALSRSSRQTLLSTRSSSSHVSPRISHENYRITLLSIKRLRSRNYGAIPGGIHAFYSRKIPWDITRVPLGYHILSLYNCCKVTICDIPGELV